MNETTQLRDAILLALDARFASRGFTRRRPSYAWRHAAAPGITHGVHINFGLYPRDGRVSAVPSIGTRIDAVDRLMLAAGLRATSDSDRLIFTQLLPDLAGASSYDATVATDPDGCVDTIWADWCAVGELAVARLSDLSTIITMLSATDPKDWCCPSRSHRARLLPIALAAAGRSAEALSALDWIRTDIASRDQMLPPFEQFETWFRAQAA
jgi:hypothetical protein